MMTQEMTKIIAAHVYTHLMLSLEIQLIVTAIFITSVKGVLQKECDACKTCDILKMCHTPNA